MFDYIKTAYNLVVGLLTENVLIISSVVLLFLDSFVFGCLQRA